MKVKSMLFSLFFFIYSCISISAKADVTVNDSLALVDLYNSTNGPGWTYNNHWLKGSIKYWYGIGVTGNRVTSVYLPGNNLKGYIPASIGNLTHLTSLVLWQNQLSDTLPSSIGKLKRLTNLVIYGNQLSGSLPSSIGNMAALTYLHLGGNQFTGAIPESIGNLINLQTLVLYYNQLSGSIPYTIGNLTNLTDLQLQHNYFTGSIPVRIGNLTTLTSLYLADNKLTGSIPFGIGNLTNLANLYLNNNQLSGSIPSSIGNLKNLYNLYLSNNLLTGIIPATFDSLSTLYHCYLDGNKLSGEFDFRLINLPNMHNLDVSNNQLTKSINVVANTSAQNKEEVYVRNNRFTFNGLEFLVQKATRPFYDMQAAIAIHKNGNVLSVSAGGTLSNNTYRWFKTGSDAYTEIVGDSTFTPAESGMYFARIKNAVATQLLLRTDTINYVSTLKMPLTLSVYPNPVRGLLTVNGLNSKTASKITIANISGTVLMNTAVRNQVSAQLNVSKLNRGNYVITVINGQEIRTVNFIKE